ncbi:MAG: GNAT family N-acetyltransferase [Candidatus Delongbacteria bacterium]|jgi:streptothricin acetyltransferase|nr:GNAT family N-acetyltransferase [Candidatus Delongbacteria bacterium]
MNFTIKRVPLSFLKEYHKVPIQFSSDIIYSEELFVGKSENINLIESHVPPFTKDYDEYESPFKWVEKWDISNWCIFKAEINNQYVAGAVIAFNTNGVNMLEGRDDIAVLWDIRVSPDHRGQGIGEELFKEAVKFAKEKKCEFLKIETQNINVNACKFYKKIGCYLGKYSIHEYKDLSDEIMMMWYYKIKERTNA